MKSITLILFSIILFASCESSPKIKILCSDIQTQLNACKTELDSTKTALTTHIAALDYSIKRLDTLQIEHGQTQVQLQNCQSTINQNQSAYQAVLNEKQNQIQILTNTLNAKITAYDELYDLHTGLLNDNYIVYKPNVIKTLTELNALIFEGETALNQLQNIEPKDETVLGAIKTTEIALAGNKGQVKAIGQMTGIQVQN